MGQSYVALYFHLIWTTKKRERYFSSSGKIRLYDYVKDMVERKVVELLAIGGMAEHVHLLVCMKTVDAIADFMAYIKPASLGFVKRAGKNCDCFSWQKGYAVFSVSASHVGYLRRYICNQENHHKIWSFDEELDFFLNF
ncbi:IS200/IS605 family transposase [Candidatus Dependentiae bacterium]|nr:IS200/IS605 family transposase [Candidatus Dependentiae bacterium]